MTIKAQIPAIASVSYDVTHNKVYLQNKVNADPSFGYEGQLFLNVPLNQIFYKDKDNIIQDLSVKNAELMDNLLLAIEQELVDADLTNVNQLSQVISLLIGIRNLLSEFKLERTN